MAQRQLVINALRMRPDRIVVGEVRGEEALDMLQAMNTGHDGSLTTIHANSPRDALYRLDTMVAMANLNIPEKAIRQQVASAIHVVAQLTRLSDGRRRVTAISEITGMEQGVITMQDIFLFERTGIVAEGRVEGHFRATGIRPKCAQQLAQAGFTHGARAVRAPAGGAARGTPWSSPSPPSRSASASSWALYWALIVRPESEQAQSRHLAPAAPSIARRSRPPAWHDRGHAPELGAGARGAAQAARRLHRRHRAAASSRPA